MRRRGLFLTFEGTEGAGKSTQLRRAAAFLRRRGVRVVMTREPGGTPAAERVRDLLLARGRRWTAEAELLLIEAARAEHVAQVIRPALARGAWVLCDRFTDATIAYQAYGRGLPLRAVRAANLLATGGVQPHHTLLLDLPASRSLRRARRRSSSRTRFEDEPDSFHRRVRAGYLAIARREPRRVHRIDAEGTHDEVWARVREAVGKLLPREASGAVWGSKGRRMGAKQARHGKMRTVTRRRRAAKRAARRSATFGQRRR